MQAATIGMFDEVDRQIERLSDAATTPQESPEPAPARLSRHTIPEVTWLPPPPVEQRRPGRGIIVAGVVVAALGLGVIAAINIAHLFGGGILTGKAAIDAAVTRIIAAESRGAADLKNKRSSAAGPAQFLDETWLELIRATRPDLAKGRNRDELLALREKPGLAREIAQRFAERNAALLTRRGLPITAATLYLAHFAGPGGAAALLTAADDADAATVMAKADMSGKLTREQIVKANPFLDKYTVADIRRWAERKMDGPTLMLTELLSANTKK